ncbi:SGNH/GDSL hydrolase family protein [Oceaniglobus roseus]|uniref:SGNH/GDSL hydrolase family protein n=1 Tax=Oceaniglobus roseus TaxID=1737570 RepID=UPI000C7F624E|nr:SGNH/GDSL hydrolase family protein [Kandeliimicrobium roseum]
MPDSEEPWRPRRIAAFLGLGLLLYAGLFLWSGRVLETHGDRNPFFRIAHAPERSDWIVLGASHALPLGFANVPETLRTATGRSTLTLAVAGGGPAVTRTVAERYFADRGAAGVLLVIDAFAFADPRWNAARLGDADLLPKIPADLRTLAVLARAVPRGLPLPVFLAQAAGAARINDRTRFRPDRWEAEARFDTAPRPSDAADAARIAYLYPGPPSEAAIAQGLADTEAVIRLARRHGARVALVFPPLPDRLRARLPVIPGLDARLADLAARLDVPLLDHGALIPEPRFYFDSDHLNRAGVALWLERGLAALLGSTG